MNLILVLLLLIAGWLLYTMMQSYNTMARELREIRLKCIDRAGATLETEEAVNPYLQMQGTVIETLQRISNKLN
jgi:hypothetical protein